MRFAILSLVASCLVFSGCNTVRKALFHDDLVSGKILRAYVDMPTNTEINQQSVQAAAVDALPPGMGEGQVYGYMQNHHISSSPRDSMAYYTPKDANGEIVCHLSYNPEPHSVVTYRITCVIVNRILKDVKVEESMKSI